MLRWKLFICTVLVSMFVHTAHAQKSIVEPEIEPINDAESRDQNAVQNDLNEELFKKLFAKRRIDHIEAVKGIQKMENYERQYKMISILAEKVFYVIESSRALVEMAEFTPETNRFPGDANIRDALSSIMENTALFGDIILHMPDITRRVLKSQEKWNSIYTWSLNFVNRMKHLLDNSTITMIHLVGQELNITAREPGYFNPFWPNNQEKSVENEESLKRKKTVKKDKKKRGPQMIKIEL
ncbi:coiled-coil domain-containing protein 134 [Cephus cinctus]|uniref:Coiled-coil domain-containing protein 134 n=1 Tax=Cephus cinctus TaxID=211228 RepID=A0AAJ7BIZ3_CEPCN|nr:coiled-coil domain-containing protein 134 [Cephus cinctus]